MSRRPGAGRRSAIGWIALAGALLAVALVAGPSAQSGPAFDPRSTSGNGTRALVLLVGQLGGTVDVSAAPPGPGTDVAVVFSDQLSDGRRAELAAWVRAGGTLVIADPVSDLQLSAARPAALGTSAAGQVGGPCPPAGLGDVLRVATGGSDLLDPAPGAVGCFPSGGHYLLLSAPSGQGRVVAVGGAGPFTNRELGLADNAILAVDLLVPRPGARVEVLLRTPVGGGTRSLWQLLGRPVHLALLQLLVAFALLGWWRSRRLGRPVIEALPVQLPGSELTVALGELMARAGRRDAAAAGLRDGVRRSVGRRLGLGAGVTPDRLADAVAIRLGTDRASILDRLGDRPVRTDADLIALAQSVERIRQEVARAGTEP